MLTVDAKGFDSKYCTNVIIPEGNLSAMSQNVIKGSNSMCNT